MSREKFEAWAEKRGHPLCDIVPICGPTSSAPGYKLRFSDIAYEAWLAGRESMRDEAALNADVAWVKNPNDFPSDAIRKIEP